MLPCTSAAERPNAFSIGQLVLRVVENALKELADKRIVNGSKGGF